jgi:hypothetical protein
MAVITKIRALNVVRRALGPEQAEAVAEHLPDRIDLADPAHAALLYRLGLTPDRLFSALGGEF